MMIHAIHVTLFQNLSLDRSMKASSRQAKHS
jgi:hypothetical protein